MKKYCSPSFSKGWPPLFFGGSIKVPLPVKLREGNEFVCHNFFLEGPNFTIYDSRILWLLAFSSNDELFFAFLTS